MFFTLDKALVALVMALVFLANRFLGLDFGLNEDVVATVVAGLMPVLVWWFPNKAAK